MLWVRGHFWQGELLLIVNLFNLTLLYFGHPTTPLFIHLPVVSAPLAWNYVAILWDGAAMVNAHTLPARIVANIFIWGILVLGGFFLLTFKDYTMGLELAVLSLGKRDFFLVYMDSRLTTRNSACHWTNWNTCHCVTMDFRLRHCWLFAGYVATHWSSQVVWPRQEYSTGRCHCQ
jgi:hypothetical protein